MKKSILNIGKNLSKTAQKNINGGMVNCPSTPICYGVFDGPISLTCGTCREFNALPPSCQNRVLVSVRCFSF